MFEFFVNLFAAITMFFTGPAIAPSVTTQPDGRPEATQSATPTKIVAKTQATPKPTVITTPLAVKSSPTPTPASISVSNSFTPIIKSGSFRHGSGNCSANPSGSYTFEIVNYNEKDNITGVKFKGSAQGLSPNTRYIVNVGSSTSLGGPSATTDANGSLEFNLENIAYSVHYKEIYSVSIDDPNKIYPENFCLLGDIKEGLGYESTLEISIS